MMRRFSLKAAALAGVLLAGALLPALAQQSNPIVGDVNGDGRITSADALAVYAYLAGRPLPASFDVLGRGDADGDGRITRADGDLIMRAAVGQAVADRPVGKPAEPGTGPAEGVLRLRCTASVRSGTVSCDDASAAATSAQGDRIAYGGQHVNVSMLTSNIEVANDTFAFDLRVKNLIGQAIGTNDGTTVDPVKVFVAGDVQNLSANGIIGPITMANHDGVVPSPFTSEPNKYFSYPEIIQPGATSSARRWKIHLTPGALDFRFFLYVSSPVVFPHGWVDVYPKTAEISAGATLQLIDTVRNHLGRPTGQKAAWSSASPAIATVDANGLVTAVSDGVVEITGSAPPRAPGKMTLTVRTASLDSSTITANPDTLPVRQKSVLTLQLRSAGGAPLTRSGGTVVFSASGGTLLGLKDNGDGTYSDTLTSTAVGSIKVSATLNGAAFRDTAEVVFTAGAATGYRVTSSAASVAAGSPVTITAQTIDADGNAVSGAGATVTWTSTNGGTFASATSPVDATGAASVVFTTSTTAGVTHTVTATDAASLTGTSGNIVTEVGAATKLVFTQQPTDVTAGSAITPAVTVAVQDANGNVVASATDSVSIAIDTNAGSGTLSGTTKVLPVNGVATFSNLAIDKSGTGYTLAAASGSLTGATSSTFNVAAGAASQLTVTTQPSDSVQSGAAFPQQPSVQLRDANGNVVAQSGVTVTAAIATGGGSLGGTATASTNASGVATFTDLSIAGTVGDRTLSFSATGVTGATSSSIHVRAGAASQLTITTQPSATTASGAAFAQQPVVQLQDASGNAVAQSGVTVTAAIASGGGTLGGTATASTNASGVATFTDLSITGTAGDRTLSFSATGLTGATSGTISVTAGAASQLTITTQPSDSVQSGVSFPQQPSVQLRDASGNAVAQAGVTVTAAIASGGGTLGGTATANTDANGTATFTDLSITGTAGDRTLSFSATGLTGATSGTISVTAGAATQLTITTQPSSSAQNGAAFAQQPVVQLQDASGNPVAQSGVTVTAAIASGGGTLGGTATANTDANGTATFTDLSITGTVGDRTLSSSATGLTGATSSSMHVRAGAASQVVITTQPSSTAAAGAAFAQQPVVQIQDASGNAVAQSGVTVTAAIASGGGTLGGTATATTDANGTATFTGLSIGGTVGDRTLSFSATGLTPATSGTISVTAGPATALAFSVQPSNVVASAAIAPAVQVSIVDAFGNVTASTDNVTVAIGTNPSGGTLSGTATVAAAAGVATFSNLSINLTGTGYTLAASSGSLTGATSSAFNVTHGPLHHFLVEAAGGGPIGNQLSGTPFNVRVTAQDEYNNTVTSFTGTVGFTSAPTGGISAGNTSGAFTAGVLTSHSITFGTPGAFTLTATNTAAGAQTGTSNSFEVQAPPVAVNEGPASNSTPGQPFHAFFSTSGSPQTYTLAAPGVLSNDNLGFPAATITSFGADSLGGSVTTYAAGSTVSPLPGTNRTTGSLSVGADGTITFTPPDGFTGNYVFRYRLTNVRGTADGQVTIAVGVRPSAVSDNYSATHGSLVGNVPINTATSTQFRVTSNDAGDAKVLAITGVSNGTATLNADSTFTFRPTAGYNGAASFTYTVTNGFGTSAAATVSMTVGTPIWFISQTAAAGGDGRYDAPFNALSSFAAINNGTGNNPAANDGIFLYTGSYTGPVALLNGQRLIGQRATASLSSIAGVTWPADSGAEPVMSSVAALDVTASGTTAVTLNGAAGSNLIRGVNFGNVGAAGTALAGTSFGTLNISEVGINTNGRALNLTTGTLNGSLTGLTSTGGANNVLLTTVGTTGTFSFGSGALSGATTSAIGINGGAGTFAYSGTITNAAGAFTVQDQNRTGGALSLTGLITSVGKGISATGAVGSTGTIEITNIANTIAAAANETALNVTNTVITANGLKFRSITASGAPNGIVLNNTGTLGGLAVSGNGAAGTGGTIQNTSISGISLTNTRNASFSWMNLTNANSTDGGGAGVCDGSTNTGCNGAIKLNGVTNVTFDRLALSGSAEQGINGTNVTRLTLSNSTISGAGNEINESGIYLFGLFGTTAAGTANSITNTTVTGSGSGNHNVFIRNSTATNAAPGAPDRLLISSSSFVNPGSALTPSDGITVSLRTSANFQTVVQNSQFTQATATNGTDGIQVDAGDNSVSDVSITGSTFTGWNQAPINISSAGNGQQTFNVFNNPTITAGVGQGINVIANNNSVAKGFITGNTNVSSSNVGNNGVGIALESGVTSRVIASVTGNTVTNFAYGVRVNAREVGSAQLDLTLANNTVTAGGNNAFAGLFAENGNGNNQNTRLCMNLSNNNISKGANPAAFIDYSMGSYVGSAFQLQGYAGSAGDATAVQNFVSSRDVGGAGVDVTAGTTVNFTSATCTTP